jgi:hypothetical protein
MTGYNQEMDEQVPTPILKRPGFRFSLRWLFLFMTLVACWLGWNLHQIHQRELVSRFIAERSGVFTLGPSPKPWKALPWTWRLLQVKPVQRIDFPGTYLSKEDFQQIEASFPEADIHYN